MRYELNQGIRKLNNYWPTSHTYPPGLCDFKNLGWSQGLLKLRILSSLLTTGMGSFWQTFTHFYSLWHEFHCIWKSWLYSYERNKLLLKEYTSKLLICKSYSCYCLFSSVQLCYGVYLLVLWSCWCAVCIYKDGLIKKITSNYMFNWLL